MTDGDVAENRRARKGWGEINHRQASLAWSNGLRGGSESIDGVRGKGKRGSRGGTKTHGRSVLAFRAADSTPMASGRRFQHSNGSVEDNMRGNSQEPPAAASLVPSGDVYTLYDCTHSCAYALLSLDDGVTRLLVSGHLVSVSHNGRLIVSLRTPRETIKSAIARNSEPSGGHRIPGKGGDGTREG